MMMGCLLQTLKSGPPPRPASPDSLWEKLENHHFHQVSSLLHMLIQVRTTGIIVNMSSAVQIPVPPLTH